MCVCVVFIYLYGPFREMNHIEQAFSSFLPISKQTPNSLTSKNLLTFLSFKRTKIFLSLQNGRQANHVLRMLALYTPSLEGF